MSIQGSVSRRVMQVVAVFVIFLAAGPLAAAEPALVMDGYDPVAYFTQGKPMKGSERFVHDWDEGRYYFASAAHRDMFAADPDRYAPRFGGKCTASLTRGAHNPGDPNYWAIVDGKLYLVGAGKGGEVAMKAVERLKTDPTMLQAAQANWARR
jgi:hypothetical protein